MASSNEVVDESNAQDATGDAAAEDTTSDAASSGDGVADDAPKGPWTEQSIVIPSDPITEEYTFDTYPADAYTHDDVDADADELIEMFRSMTLQRRFEQRCRQQYQKQNISGFLHLYIGQEAVSTGSVHAIRLGEDSVITAYRDHGMGLAMGMEPGPSMAELFGKGTGSSRGKGGSMHFFDKEQRLFGGHGIVGAHVPVGAGIAFAHTYRGEDNVCLCFLGDGAVNQGAFHEALNLASLYDLPLVTIIENNQYAMGTAVDRASSEPDLFKQALSYDMPAALVSGMDVFSVKKAVHDHAEMARQGQPSLLEIRTYRYQGHSISDPAAYRKEGELDERKSEDAIVRLQRYIIANDIATEDELDAIDDELKQTVLDAIDFAEESDFPDESELYDHVYAQDDYRFLN
ncbi:MAG: pyruvate dehydrogenase (acetyl-transferring) E1 component subunit alpha [Longimonas sp.]|uniref:pyruvate dehydrogenase (acetyl-transferring) E1 component subunit alpha n=1 Tax=Longimonas sp. TaxID=2039626 RepID=UPI00397473C6